MSLRSVNRVIKSTPVDMGGFKVDQPLPNFGMDQFDPILLIHHAKHVYPGGQRPSQAGVGPHPHRGFSPVTFIIQGVVHHRDSRGNDQVVTEGGLQWMSAGMGLVHSERPSKELAEKGGPMEIVQVWINTPKANKLDQPFYQPVSITEAKVEQINDRAELITYAGEGGPVQTLFPLQLQRINMKKGGKVELDTISDQNLLLYQLNGLSQINEREVSEKKMVVFKLEEGNIRIEAMDNTQFILLSGKPLGEPVSSYGPYVMNTQTELLEAMRDYQIGKMGVLVEEFD